MKKLLAVLVIIGVAAGTAAAGQPPQKQEKQQAQGKVYIPKEVKEPMMAGQAARQARLDIPFSIFKNLFLPAQQAQQAILFFKAKNADLGFAAAVAPQIADATDAAQPKMHARLNLFLQFHTVENGQPVKLIKEIFVPATLEADQAGYDPEAEAWYTIGYPLMPGNYLASLAIASQDLKKIGIQYYELSLPDAKSFTQALDTTPVFFMKGLKQEAAPELTPLLHKGLFAYSVLKITPSIDHVFKVGDALDTFFYIYGVQPKDGGKYDIAIDFEVYEGEKLAIKFAPGAFDNPLVSLPLQLKQTLLIKKGDEERTETRDLPAGDYTFVIKVEDKVSGLKGEKKVPFKVV
ncbi:MAG: hypothetical protein FJY80_00030 [Candidatus Aminicenantes bacterium]|nr:hypothetical protein [Candidatus Aminicenantes bacterium]